MALNEQAIHRAVELLRRGRETPPTPIDQLPPHAAPSSLADAMQLQSALNRLLVRSSLGPVIGTKIGCTTEVMQRYLGMSHPCSGAVFESTIKRHEGRFDYDSFLHVGVECEIAVTLDRPIRSSDAPHDLHSVSESVGSVHAAIEIVDDRYVDFENRRPDWKTWVADNFFGSGAVLGTPVSDSNPNELPSTSGVMRINGREVGQGVGRDIVNGHPLEALAWLANEQANLCNDLPSDWIVLLGSVVQTKWVNRGDVVEVELDGLGTAKAIF